MQIIFLIWLLLRPMAEVSSQTLATIYISEIGAHEKSDYEWIEIHNSGDVMIDLTGWKFYEDKTHHSLTSYQGDLIIEPGEYAIIADVATKFLETHQFEGTVIDSSWSSLLEGGEEIGLKDKDGNVIDLFTYPPLENTSLQKIGSEWIAHFDSDSAGKQNEAPQNNNEMPSETNNQSSVPHQVPPMSGTILINEVYPYPNSEKKEWIELYNNSEQLFNLDEWYFQDGAGNRKYLEGEILGHRHFLVEYEKSWLNNSSEKIELFESDGNKIDYIVWGNWNDDNLQDNNLPAPKKGQALARIIDGAYTNNLVRDFSITTTPTPSKSNTIVDPISNKKLLEVSENNEVTTKLKEKAPIRINEVFANPKGSDLIGEYIELMNISDQPLSLNGWVVKDNSKMSYVIKDLTLPSLGIIFLRRSETKLALNNDEDVIKIYNPKGELIETLEYKNAVEDQSYSFFENGYSYTTTPTPGLLNIYSLPNQSPTISLICEKDSEIIICDASDTYDFNGDEVRFLWTLSKNDTTVRQFVHDVVEIKESEGDLLQLEVSDGRTISRKEYSWSTKKESEAKFKATSISKVEKPKTDDLKIIEDKEIFELNTVDVNERYRTSGEVSKVNKSSFQIKNDEDEILVRVAKGSEIDTSKLNLDDNVTISGELRQGKNERYLFAGTDDTLKINRIEAISETPKEDVVIQDVETINIPKESEPRLPVFPIVAATTSLLAITWHSLMRRPAWQARVMLWRGRVRGYINNLLLRIWRK